MKKRVAVVGGGAAGFFLAVNLKEMAPDLEVDILERSKRVLTKVEISGGGRCNCTNTFADVADLSHVYPRGHRLMKRLFKVFSPQDACEWFESRGVRLVAQPDQCIFPQTQDSHTIINCFVAEARRLGVHIKTGHAVRGLDDVSQYDFVAVTTGGQPLLENLKWLADSGHELMAPVPSLFTFSIDDPRLHALMGAVVEGVRVHMPGTKLRAEGPLLITHWGMSGPAILKLSSHAARLLAEANYQLPLSVNWTGLPEADVQQALAECITTNRQKQLGSTTHFGLTSRLWNYLLERALPKRVTLRWDELGKKDLNRLVNTLTNDTYDISGRAPFKDEFVTCGGVSLASVSPTTLESRTRPSLYFAGEILDIDGITGGFNFQAAWTTAYVAAQAIATNSKNQNLIQLCAE